MFSWLLSAWRWKTSAAIILAIAIFLGIYLGVVVPGSNNTGNAGTNNVGFYLEP